ncbi:putative nuclease HARBI1 [Prorops nasuta]|uniref:putative nuclease HARBI1 n=1 Tax=Prorops nasuta TaxID=863751 RepID=UPI0034CF714C
MVVDWLFNDNELNDDNEATDQLQHRRPRIIRDRMNWFQLYDDVDFKIRFRLSKEMVNMLMGKIEHKLIVYNTERNNTIPPIIQLLVTLRFMASGSFLISITDFCGISKSSAQRIVHKISTTIAEMYDEYIKFPTDPNDISKTEIENFKLPGFIPVIGAIDGFHVKIQSYGGGDSELFRNRKGFFSLNVQAIVNCKLQFLDLVVRWPGSIHDATIFDNSQIKARFENGEFGNAILLGDSGYPCLPYLLTPLQNPESPGEVLYNESLIRTRSMVERCFGVFGKMFPILTIGSRLRTPSKTMTLIIACGILHNISRSTVEPEDINEVVYNRINSELDENLHNDERRYLIENYFTKLVQD